MKINILVLFIVFFSCSTKDHKSQEAVTALPFINRPISYLDIPFEKYTIIAEKGAKVVAASGSFIEFPPSAFVDKNGELISGEVDISFREFLDPVDLYLSGIPMQYDTLGTSFVFESSAMCQIYAFQNNESVFINPSINPTLHLITKNDDTRHNLYFLDTLQEKWFPLGKSKIEMETATQTHPKVTRTLKNEKVLENSIDIPEPIKANSERPIITVTIPYVDFVPELQIFKNTKFEVDISEKNYNPKDGDIEWDKVKLEKTDSENLYNLIFTLGKRSVSYKVRPVYEGEDYEVAMNTYLDKMEKISEKNSLKQFSSQADSLAENYNLHETKIYRKFSILNFGIYNCDYILQGDFIELNATFIDPEQKPLTINSVEVLNLNRNAKINYDPKAIKLSLENRQAMFVIKKDTFLYMTPTDLLNSKISSNTKSTTFMMNRFIGEIESPTMLKRLLEI